MEQDATKSPQECQEHPQTTTQQETQEDDNIKSLMAKTPITHNI